MLKTGLELLLGPDGRKIASPDQETTAKLLCALPPDADRWATLSFGISFYVTATPCPAGGFAVEVELGSRDFHNRISGEPVSLQEVLVIFTAFARKDQTWMDQYQWERVPFGEIDFRKAPDTMQGRAPFANDFPL